MNERENHIHNISLCLWLKILEGGMNTSSFHYFFTMYMLKYGSCSKAIIIYHFCKGGSFPKGAKEKKLFQFFKKRLVLSGGKKET